MRPKILVVLSWLVVLMLVLSSCGGGGSDEAPAEGSAPAEQAAPAAEAAATEAPAEDDTTQATEGESETSEEAQAVSAFAEAPMLAEMVAAGSLPPVDERLPKDYMVVEPVEQVGTYGGTLLTGTEQKEMSSFKMWLYDPPVRWKADYSGYEPGLAKEYSWSEDGTEVTWVFREGVKWSDGTPFTMADMQFWWEDLAKNEDFKVVNVPWWGFKSDGTPMDVTFPNDYTMVMKWDKPQWITPFIVAQGFWEWEPLMAPKHYLQQFHPEYTDGATYEDLEQKRKWWENPDFPTLFAWQLESYDPGQSWKFVRNPYYWKVDTAGNQLPYIDRVEVEYVESEETRILNIAQGKYDLNFRGGRDSDIPLFTEQAETNGYEVLLGWMLAAGARPGWLINQDYIGPGDDADLDAEIRMVLRDKRFRQALSWALDRQRIIDVGFDGFGEAKAFTISRQSWHFQSPEGQEIFQQWEQAYAQLDPDMANSLLDEVGMVDTDGDGIRELPSGKPFQLIIDYGEWGAGAEINLIANEIFAENLKGIGIDSIINNLIGQPDWDLRQTQAKYMLRNAGTSELDIWTYPDWVFPVRDNRAFPLQGKWRQTGGEEGEEPLADSPAARLQALYDQGLAEPDPQKRHEIVWEAVKIHIEEGPFMLGAAGDAPQPVIRKLNIRNVPETGILGPWAPGSPGNKYPEQFYIEQ
jgi:peptide/nickel transport system substrate-binding protein